MTLALSVHKATWRLVDRFLAVSAFVGEGLKQQGVDPTKVVVQPSPVPDPGPARKVGTGALFLGRLTVEKGILLLLEAWRTAGLGARHTLTIAGDGPCRELVSEAASSNDGIMYVGQVGADQARRLYRSSAAVLVPSLWHEPASLAVLEAFSHGRAVVASDRGALPERVDSSTGWVVTPTVQQLAEGLRAALDDRLVLQQRGTAARRLYEQRYSEGDLADALVQNYREVSDADS